MEAVCIYLLEFFALLGKTDATLVPAKSNHQTSSIDREIVRSLKCLHGIVHAIVVQKCVACEFGTLSITDIDAFGRRKFFFEYRYIQLGR